MSHVLTAMPPTEPTVWTDTLRQALERYDESLLRQVAVRLCKPRNQWPAEELIERCLAAVGNPTVIDRRLSDLPTECVQLLALIGHSREPVWRVGNLVELGVALGQPDGLRTVLTLLEAGLAFPSLGPLPVASEGAAPRKLPRLKTFEGWFGQTGSSPPAVCAPPEITARAMGLATGLPECPAPVVLANPLVHEADGLDWPLKLSALWQEVFKGPLRKTQSAGFFKRDLDRLRGHPLLSAPAPDALMEIPDPALLAVGLATGSQLLRNVDGEIHHADFPPAWSGDIPTVLAELWIALLHQDEWNPIEGWRPDAPAGNPRPSAWLLTLVLLGRLPANAWVDPAELERWIGAHHPFWRDQKVSAGIAEFLLGLAHPLRLVQAAREGKGPWLVRLSPVGRWLLGLGSPPTIPVFPQTLLVQPNLEILAYRQGLTPQLIARLAKLADWQAIGPACTLRLSPESVYRALEAGESFETIQDLLQRFGMKALPDAVVSALRTWSNKRERIRVFTAGALFEFQSAEDMADAQARGIPLTRLAERLAVAPSDRDLDYRHFRLTATRDYALPPDRCVDVASDGVTLTIDLAKSDLLVETETRRFADLSDRAENNGRLVYRVTPESLARARESGLTLAVLESWFLQRGGQPLPAAVKLLFYGAQLAPYEVRRTVVLHVPSPEIADGILQWPGTRALIEARLGATALAIAEEHVGLLSERLKGLGIALAEPGGTP